jgi:hypothetical protein
MYPAVTPLATERDPESTDRLRSTPSAQRGQQEMTDGRRDGLRRAGQEDDLNHFCSEALDYAAAAIEEHLATEPVIAGSAAGRP